MILPRGIRFRFSTLTLLLATCATACLFAIYRHLHQPIVNIHPGEFNGRSSVVEVGDRAILDLENCFTIEAHLKIPAGQSTRLYTSCIVGKGKGAGNTNHNYYLGIVNKDRRIQFHIGDGAGNYQELVSAARIPVGRWTHVAAVRSQSALQIFVDGKLDASVRRTLDQNANNAPLRMGATEERHSLHHIAAEIDMVRIWNRALAGEELKSSLVSDANRMGTGLVLLSRSEVARKPEQNDIPTTKRLQSDADVNSWSPDFANARQRSLDRDHVGHNAIH